MSHLSYEESKKGVYKGLALLAIITLIEVAVSLFGKGFIFGGSGLQEMGAIKWIVILLLIGLSLYKARFIIFEFMHMSSEVKSLSWAVIMPLGLLVWAMYPFFQEGDSWKNRRENNGNPTDKKEEMQKAPQQEGSLLKDTDIFDPRG